MTEIQIDCENYEAIMWFDQQNLSKQIRNFILHSIFSIEGTPLDQIKHISFENNSLVKKTFFGNITDDSWDVYKGFGYSINEINRTLSDYIYTQREAFEKQNYYDLYILEYNFNNLVEIEAGNTYDKVYGSFVNFIWKHRCLK